MNTEQEKAAPAARPCARVQGMWYLGTMNDGLFIIDTPPRPSTEDAWHDRPDGPQMVIPVSGIPEALARDIVEAHNACIARATSPAAAGGITDGGLLDWLQSHAEVRDLFYGEMGIIIKVNEDQELESSDVRSLIREAMEYRAEEEGENAL